MDAGGWSASGNAVKNSPAMRASSAGSGRPGGKPSVPGKTVAQLPVTGIAAEARVPSLVLMVLSYVYVFEQGNGIVRKHGGRAVQRNQVRGESSLVDTHEANRQARTLLSGQSGLKEADHTLLSLANPQQQDLGLGVLVPDVDLVGGNQRDAAPGKERCTEKRHGRRRHAATRALPSEGGDGARVSEEEGRLLPDFCQHFVQIVRGRSAFPRLQLLRGGNVIQKSVVSVGEELTLLLLFNVFDNDPQLLSNLIVRIAEKIGDAGVDVEDSVDAAQPILPRLLQIFGISRRQSCLVDLAAGGFDRLALIDAVQSEGSGLERLPIQKTNQPTCHNSNPTASPRTPTYIRYSMASVL